MAARFWVGSGLTGNYIATSNTNWGSSSGNNDNASVPTSTDAVTFDGADAAANENCIITSAVAAASINITAGYTGTITMSNTWSASGSITTASGGTYTLAGSGSLRMIAAGTWTTNGRTIEVAVVIGATTSFTCTLAGTLTLASTLSLTNTTSTTFSGAHAISATSCTISGSQTVTIVADVTLSGALTISDANVLNGAFNWNCAGLTMTAAISSGTATVRLTGGTWSGSGVVGCPLVFAGDVTISGTVAFGVATGIALTWESGTITTTGSTLSVTVATSTFNTNGMTWNNITQSSAAAPTFTLTSALTWSGLFTIASGSSVTFSGAFAMTGGSLTLSGTGTQTFNVVSVTLAGTLTLPNNACTLAGSVGVTAATWANATLNGARTWTLTAGNAYVVTSACNLTGASSGNTGNLTSSHGANKVAFVLGPGATQDMIFVNATRVDSTAGQACYSARGVLTTCFNWLAAPNVNCQMNWPTMQLGM